MAKAKKSAGDILTEKFLRQEISKLVARYETITGNEATFKINHKPVKIPPLPFYRADTRDIFKMTLNRAFKVAAACAITILGVAATGVPIPGVVLYIATGVIALTAGEKALKETVKARNGGKTPPTSLTDIIRLIVKLVNSIYNYLKERRRK